ncbi:Serine/threonine-protein kinase/endoribonuclease IRE1 [Orchesella cincta]|uniref:Serine/threonine-protein kinase/endoribonuclease IRE1 n=1 Tax=Orchesella cincta TaxID=48709 RepID=A0A1D2MER0_ORCCI|nr:Serine/threonine-protein kinase/endoribonuclease IRE1 [Orchesella cincta]
MHSLPGANSAAQSTKLYRKIVTRQNGFTNLMDILKETNQTEARNILKTAIARWRHTILYEVNRVSYDPNTILGKGSNEAVVFKGKFAGRDVAVKQVNSGSKQEKIVINEIENLKKCDSQENIIRYYGTTVVENFILIVVELCEISLKDWLPAKPLCISPAEILRQVTVGLKWLHSKRIVHRDLKPGNILLTSSHSIRAKISDFGLSRKIEEGRNHVLSCGLGTQGWIAPEILLQFDENISAKYKFTFESDIFSLGCVFYYVLTNGKHPFGGQVMRNANILIGKHEIDPQRLSCSAAENVKIITLMISKDVKLRPSCLVLLSSSIFMNHEDKITKCVENGDMDGVQPIVKSPRIKRSTKITSVSNKNDDLVKTFKKSGAESTSLITGNPVTKGNINMALTLKDVTHHSDNAKATASRLLENNYPAESSTYSSFINSNQLPPSSSQNINRWSTVEHSPRVQDGRSMLQFAKVCLETVEYLLHQQQFSKELPKNMHAALIIESMLVYNICVSSDEEFENKSYILNLILSLNPDLVNSGIDILNKALYEARRMHTKGKHVDVFRILLQHNADVNAADEAGETPLFYATKFFGKTPNYLGIVKILMEYQADPNKKIKEEKHFFT